MVFFSCDGCAEMLKKNQVDAHARKCRSCDSVSCVDCSVSFWGGRYIQDLVNTQMKKNHMIRKSMSSFSDITTNAGTKRFN
jgi:hypothetical protein